MKFSHNSIRNNEKEKSISALCAFSSRFHFLYSSPTVNESLFMIEYTRINAFTKAYGELWKSIIISFEKYILFKKKNRRELLKNENFEREKAQRNIQMR